MKFNYQARYKKFRNDERRFAMEAFRGGMKKEDILEIIKFDWEVFKSERIFCIHNQQMIEFKESAQRTDGMNPLQERFIRKTDRSHCEGTRWRIARVCRNDDVGL